MPSGGKFIVAEADGISRPGFTFSRWSDGNDPYLAGATYTVGNANVVLTAIWITAVPQTIAYALNNGTGSVPIQAAVPTGGTFTVLSAATISRSGFAFAGWSDGVNILQPGSTYTVGTSNVILSAQWQSAVTRTIAYSLSGGFGTRPSQSPVAVGATFSVAASNGLSKTGSSFGGWSDGEDVYAPGDKYTVGATNITLSAVWIDAITRSVTYTLGGGVGTVPTQSPVAEGATFRIPSGFGITRVGFTFNGWSNGRTTYPAGTTVKMGSTDILLTALWRSR